MSMMAEGTYPLLFAFPDVIVGQGFVASVEISGRALLTVEPDGDTWIYGVEPGSVAGGGKDYAHACRAFKENYLTVLFDIAAESPTYEVFSAQVREFFETVNRPNLVTWEAALSAVRDGTLSSEGFTSVKAETRPPHLALAKLEPQDMRPQVNQLDVVSEAA